MSSTSARQVQGRRASKIVVGWARRGWRGQRLQPEVLRNPLSATDQQAPGHQDPIPLHLRTNEPYSMMQISKFVNYCQIKRTF